MKNTPTNRPRIEDQKHYKKIGRLSPAIAKSICRKSADIYVSENYLKHIFIKHKNELAKIGCTPMMFLDTVVNGFNRIYKGKRNERNLFFKRTTLVLCYQLSTS